MRYKRGLGCHGGGGGGRRKGGEIIFLILLWRVWNESKEKKGENEVHTFCRIPTRRFELNPARGTTAILKQIQILCEKQAGT